MRKNNGFASAPLVVLVVILAAGIGYFAFQSENNKGDKFAVEQTVKFFGTQLRSLEKFLPEPYGKTDIKVTYFSSVSKKLLNQWLANPKDAPGKYRASPEPNRIEIETITKVSESEYAIQGSLFWVGGGGAKETVNLTVILENGNWVVDSFTFANKNAHIGEETSPPQSLSDITLISPNGGEKYAPGDIIKFIWSKDNKFALQISLLKKDSVTPQSRQLILDQAIVVAERIGGNRFDWRIPRGLESGQYFVSITCDDDSCGQEYFDYSDSPLTITQ